MVSIDVTMCPGGQRRGWLYGQILGLLCVGVACTTAGEQAAASPVSIEGTFPKGQVDEAASVEPAERSAEVGTAQAEQAVEPKAEIEAEIEVEIEIDERALRARLAAQAVVHHGPLPLPRVLYSWTTREQIAAMAEDRQLFRRSRSETGELSRYDAFLREQGAALPGPARILRSPSCAKHRFAWPNPWATALGFGGEHYGEMLLEIVLRPDSILVVVDSAGPTWGYFRLDGSELSRRQAMAARSRIVGALHTGAPTIQGRGTFESISGWPLREFVLCNESQIERWSYGTAAILTRLDDDLALVRGLNNLPFDTGNFSSEWTYAKHLYGEIWGRPANAESLAADLGAAMAWTFGVEAGRSGLGEVTVALEAARAAQVAGVREFGEIVEPPMGGEEAEPAGR